MAAVTENVVVAQPVDCSIILSEVIVVTEARWPVMRWAAVQHRRG